MRKIAMLLGMLAFVATACGGDTKVGAGGTAGTDGGTAGGTVTTTTGGDGDICGIGRGLESLGELLGGVAAATDPSAFDDFVTNLDQASAQIDAAVAASPDEIRADFQLMADTFKTWLPLFREMAPILQQAQSDPTKVDPGALTRLQEISAELEATVDQTELQAAGDRISAYFARECGITFDE